MTEAIMQHMNARDELVQYYRWLRHYGYNDSHSGNASLRTATNVWITPRGAAADTLRSEDLIACDLVTGPGPGASLDAALHLRVYQANPANQAILHSHNPYSVAMTLDGKDFYPLDYEGQLYFPKVPVLNIPYNEYEKLSPSAIAETLAEYPIAIVRGHGVYASAANLNLAYKWICSLEQSAKTAYLAIRLNKALPLNQE